MQLSQNRPGDRYNIKVSGTHQLEQKITVMYFEVEQVIPPWARPSSGFIFCSVSYELLRVQLHRLLIQNTVLNIVRFLGPLAYTWRFACSLKSVKLCIFYILRFETFWKLRIKHETCGAEILHSLAFEAIYYEDNETCDDISARKFLMKWWTCV